MMPLLSFGRATRKEFAFFLGMLSIWYGRKAPTVAPFVIPQRDDDLLQYSNTIYYVGELIQDEEEIRDAVKMFRLGVVQQGDFEHIAAHFDHFFPLVRTAADGGSAGTFDARLRVELAELLIHGTPSGFQAILQ
uniref:HECT domain-containing protein n=1 Tax=Globodera pallida TaxID=36090 RepID=A0A183C3W1_GLOPA